AGRKDGIRLVDGSHDVHDAELVSLQLYGIDINLDLAVLATERLGYGCPRNICNLVAYRELSDVVQLRLVQAGALQRDQANRQARGVKLQYHGWQGTGRQSPKLCHGQIRDGADRSIRIGARLEVHADQADSCQRARHDVIDAAAQREKSLKGI